MTLENYMERWLKMAAITLEVAREHLNTWLEAETALASSQSYTIGTMSLTRADLKSVRENIEYWSKTVTRLERNRTGRNRVYRIVPHD